MTLLAQPTTAVRAPVCTDKLLLEESTGLRAQVADQQKQIIILRHDASQGRGSSVADPTMQAYVGDVDYKPLASTGAMRPVVGLRVCMAPQERRKAAGKGLIAAG